MFKPKNYDRNKFDSILEEEKLPGDVDTFGKKYKSREREAK